VESTLTIKEESTLIRDRHHKPDTAEVDIAVEAEEVDIVAEEVDEVAAGVVVVDEVVVVVVVVMDNFTLGYVGDSLGTALWEGPGDFVLHNHLHRR
jgi:hypothetical protein